jgi:hypothetical protein
MSFETWMSIINTVFVVVMAVFVAPLRTAAAKADALKDTVDKMGTQLSQLNVEQLSREHKETRRRLIDLEDGHKQCLTQLPVTYATRADILRAEEHRERQLGLMNGKLDQLLANDATQTETLRLVEKGQDTLFRIHNESRRKS